MNSWTIFQASPSSLKHFVVFAQGHGEGYSSEWTLLVRRMAAWEPRPLSVCSSGEAQYWTALPPASGERRSARGHMEAQESRGAPQLPATVWELLLLCWKRKIMETEESVQQEHVTLRTRD